MREHRKPPLLDRAMHYAATLSLARSFSAVKIDQQARASSFFSLFNASHFHSDLARCSRTFLCLCDMFTHTIDSVCVNISVG